MFFRTNITDRRTFLARTALGAGSMFFLPELLTSCTDHNLPDPSNPINPPLGDNGPSDNDTAKICVITALGMIPEVGEILAALVEIFWPNTKEDPWDEVKDRVQELIKKDLDDFVYQDVKEALGGFKDGQAGGLVGTMNLYLQEVKAYNEARKTNPNASPSGVLMQWGQTRTAFVGALTKFQKENYQELLLPFFTQYANLYLALMRDGVLHGKDWGRSDTEHLNDISDLKTAITAYSEYALRVYYAAVTMASTIPIGDGSLECEPGKSSDKAVRELTLSVLDYRALWPYFDVTLYPNGPRVPITREIFSGMNGYCIGYDLLTSYGYPALKSTTKAPTQITIWGGEIIEGLQVTYPANGGPDGITQTKRMGLYGRTDGSTQPPKGGIFHISPTNPIVLVRLSFNKDPYTNDKDFFVVSAIQFVHKDGETTPWTGTLNKSSVVEVKPPFGHYISSIYFSGYLAVFGFQYINFEAPSGTDAMRTVYITSPTERTADDFAKAFPEIGDASKFITEQLKADREAYWAALKARAAALK